MNHLLRELAPLSDAAWAEIDEEATRTLAHFYAARKLVDFDGPLGYAASRSYKYRFGSPAWAVCPNSLGFRVS